jgi:hypothetical protein
MVCRRGDGDELLDKLAVKWSVNLVRIPRGGIEVGDVFVGNKRILDQWDRLRDLYRPKLELPRPKPRPVPDMARVESKSYNANAGFEALEGFLQGLGVPAVPLRAAIKAARTATVSLSFSVGNVRRTGLLPGEINREMNRRAKGAHWESVDMTQRHYVAHAVWDARSLQVKVEGEAKTVSELSASLTKVAKATAGLTTKRDSSGLISYDRDQPIVFGLQVTAVRFDGGVPTLDGAVDPGPMQVRRGDSPAGLETEDPASGTLIGARNGNPFVQLRQE